MRINITVIVVAIIVIALIVYLVRQNKKDKKKMEDTFNNDYPVQKHEDPKM